MFKFKNDDMEIWLDVKNYEGLYKVSNLGNIKSLGNDYKRKEKILKPGKISNGYLHVVLTKNKVKKNLKVHRIVALSFLPNPYNKPQINHINGNKIDNNLQNLEWSTQVENSNHAFKLGLNKICKKVIDIKTGMIYQSITIASNYYNIKYCKLYRMLNGVKSNETNLRYL